MASSGSLSLEERASILSEKYSSSYKVTRDSSVDDLLKSFNENREKRRKELDALLASTKTDTAAAAAANGDSDSGRSTPEFLKKYSVKYHFSNKDKNENSTETDDATTASVSVSTSAEESTNKKRLRTFSETLKMLDDDILADLEVK